MKTKIFTILILTLTLISCHKDDDDATTTLVGSWKLKEVLADPGDGSGTFNSVNSNKILTFDTNGNVTSNGSICDFSIESNASSTGTYSEINATIIPANCQRIINYELNGNALVLTYLCIEGCQQKYIKVK